DEDADGRKPSAVLAADVHAATALFEFGNLFQWDVQAIGSINQYFFKMCQAAFGFGEADNDAEMLFSLPKFGCRFARQPNFNHILDIPYIQAVPGGTLTIDFDNGLRNFPRAINHGGLNTTDIGYGAEHFSSFGTKGR